jgi:hypothetical protein
MTVECFDAGTKTVGDAMICVPLLGEGSSLAEQSKEVKLKNKKQNGKNN